jgi:hypothetical protein
MAFGGIYDQLVADSILQMKTGWCPILKNAL